MDMAKEALSTILRNDFEEKKLKVEMYLKIGHFYP
jgi:hypothetical protein